VFFKENFRNLAKGRRGRGKVKGRGQKAEGRGQRAEGRRQKVITLP
jgi:hypothetical protein